MTRLFPSHRTVLALSAAVSLVFAACGSDAEAGFEVGSGGSDTPGQVESGDETAGPEDQAQPEPAPGGNSGGGESVPSGGVFC